MLQYPAQFTPAEEGGFVITFPDIPEAITQGDSYADALVHAQDVLESAIEWAIGDRRPVPLPSRGKPGQPLITLPASLSAKVLLLNEMLTQKVRPAELARRMKITPQEVSRLLNIRHSTKIDGIAAALKALGKTLEIRLAPLPESPAPTRKTRKAA